MFDKISSGKIYGSTGNTFAAIEIDGNGVVIRNAADETDSSGNLVTAGSDEVLSANRATGTTINASYIKTGVLDANLMRAGLIQTVPSWNTKWYGAPEDHAAVQMGFTGGSIAATAVSTGTGTVSLTLPGGHGLVTSDYIRVSGLYFTTGTLLGGVGLNLPTNGPLDYASATVATNTLTYSKADITSGLTASTASTVYVGKAHTITAVVRSFDDPENPAELSTVVVTTGAAHGFSVGEYVELVNVAATIDGVAYITAVTSTTFTFKQRFGSDVDLDLSASDLALPSLLAPVAIKVLKSYTQNADGSIHITSGTVDSTLIVGEIAATEITIGAGGTIARVGSYPDAISPTFQGFWAGAADPLEAEFSASTSGELRAINASFIDADVANLNVSALKMNGAIEFGQDSDGDVSSIQVFDTSVTPRKEVARWDTGGLQISTNGIGSTRRVLITGDQVELIDDDGNSVVAFNADGVNASAITTGSMPGGSNLVPNSSFELSPFPAAASALTETNIAGGNVNASWTSGTDTMTVTSYAY